MSANEDWKLAASMAQVFVSVVVTIALIYTIKTFYRAKRADQIKLAEGVFKDLREMQKELHTKGEGFTFEDWVSRFFNTLEWFSFLVNVNEIKVKLAKRFFRDSIIEWHDQLLPDEDKQNSKKYPELKRLYNKLKKQNIRERIKNIFVKNSNT